MPHDADGRLSKMEITWVDRVQKRFCNQREPLGHRWRRGLTCLSAALAQGGEWGFLGPMELTMPRRTPTAQGSMNEQRNRSTAALRSDASLAQILACPIDFVESIEFRRPGAEGRLFDRASEVREADVTWYRPLMDPIGTVTGLPKKAKASVVFTKAEELVIFLQYNYARFRVRRMQDRIKSPHPGTRQRTELLNWYRIAQRLRHQIAEANIALVLAMSKRIRMGDMDFSDLISEGNMALMRSIDKFDVGRGFKFSTYSCRAILKAFSRHGSKHLRYRQRFGASYDPEFEQSNYPEERRADELRDSADEVKQMVLQNHADLTDVERKVIHHRFRIGPGDAAGLRHERPRTLAQVGQMIGLTKERVRQIQNKALGKLRLAVEESSLPQPERAAFRHSWRQSAG
jgi:RNA polymerase sigma factor (sigma-70 family)